MVTKPVMTFMTHPETLKRSNKLNIQLKINIDYITLSICIHLHIGTEANLV
jgi:hypothetical protein